MTETLVVENKEINLVSVSNSAGGCGICDTTRDKNRGIKETFFVGQEAIINTLQKSIYDPYSNKIIWQSSATDKCGEFSIKIQTICDDYYLHGKPLLASLMPFLTVLKNGVYAVYETDMIQTDGSGGYFWSSYLVGHEFSGSATFSNTCGKQRNLPPCFLVPTDNIAAYSDVMVRNEQKKLSDGIEMGGIAFHVTGLFCALLSNHYAATAALARGQKFKCIVIEPVRYIMFKDEFVNDTSAHVKKAPFYDVDCLYTHIAKIPITNVSTSVLENFFITRGTEIPKNFNSIRVNSERTGKLKGKHISSRQINDNSEMMPDAEMIQSAALIDDLSELELQALLEGKTELNDQIIISKNYYSSVVNACNYLQYRNYNRFITFTTEILHNEDLVAMHLYIANRLQGVMNEQIYNTFCEIFAGDNAVYAPILSLAEKYKKHYIAYLDKVKQERAAVDEEDGENITTFRVLKRDTEQEINALDMAKKLGVTKKK